MRRRLIASTVIVVLVVIVLLGVPLAVIEARLVEQNAQSNLNAEAGRLLESVDPAMAGMQPLDGGTLRLQIARGHYAVVTVGTRRVSVNGSPPAHVPLMQARARNPREQVVVLASREPVARQIRDGLLLIVGVAGMALVAAIGMAFLQARRLARPLVELAETAERLGAGDTRPRHRRYGMVELDRVAEVIDTSAERIARMLAAERRLAADASHQLRTPLTALSMRLEEIAATDDPMTVKEEAAIALNQVERLTSVVQQLLTNAPDARSSRAMVPVNVDHVVRQQLDEWRPAFRNAGRSLVAAGGSGLVALATPGAFAQVLSTLLENSLMHGDGTVTVGVRTAGGSIVVEVADEGPGVPRSLGARVFERAVSGRASTGLGLAVAREMAEAHGARLELLQAKPPVFAIFLTAYRAGGAA